MQENLKEIDTSELIDSILNEPSPAMNDDTSIFVDVDQSRISFNSLCNLIGLKKVIAASVRHGGGLVYIPVRHKDESKITKIFGKEAAQRLGKLYGNGQIAIPSKIGKIIQIYCMHKCGYNNQEISKAFRTTDRSVRRLIRKMENEGGFFMGEFFYPINLSPEEIEAYGRNPINTTLERNI